MAHKYRKLHANELCCRRILQTQADRSVCSWQNILSRVSMLCLEQMAWSVHHRFSHIRLDNSVRYENRTFFVIVCLIIPCVERKVAGNEGNFFNLKFDFGWCNWASLTLNESHLAGMLIIISLLSFFFHPACRIWGTGVVSTWYISGWDETAGL